MMVSEWKGVEEDEKPFPRTVKIFNYQLIVAVLNGLLD